MSYENNFKQLAIDASIPTDEDSIQAEFQQLKNEHGVVTSNESSFGPFWRFVDAVATKVAKWLVDFVLFQILPQSFLETSSGVFVDLHAKSVNIERKEERKAEGVLQFLRTDTAGELIIPSGVYVQSLPINGKSYTLEVTRETVLSDGVESVLAPVIALEPGAAYNLAAHYYTVLVGTISGLEAVTNLSDWLRVPGADEETDDELKARAKNQYTAINQWHTDAVYRAIISGFDGVTTNNVYFEHDAPRGAGTANAYVMLESGNPSPEFIATIQSEITDGGNHGHGDDLVVYAMPESFHEISAMVWPVKHLTSDETSALLTDIENFIRCAFRENTNYSATKVFPLKIFSFSLLSRELHNEFDSLENIVFNLGFIDSGIAIPRIANLTISEH